MTEQPFAAAIKCLKAFKSDCKTEAFDDAIRFLEAGGKANKKKTGDWGTTRLYRRSALPDSPKEK